MGAGMRTGAGFGAAGVGAGTGAGAGLAAKGAGAGTALGAAAEAVGLNTGRGRGPRGVPGGTSSFESTTGAEAERRADWDETEWAGAAAIGPTLPCAPGCSPHGALTAAGPGMLAAGAVTAGVTAATRVSRPGRRRLARLSRTSRPLPPSAVPVGTSPASTRGARGWAMAYCTTCGSSRPISAARGKRPRLAAEACCAGVRRGI